MFGRYQPWHKGHQWLLDELLENKQYGVWIGVREIDPDSDNPYHPSDNVTNIRNWIKINRPTQYHRVMVRVIPDIEGVHYGRGVGWNITEHVPPDEISQVSATKIREKNEKILANFGKKTDAIPAGPLSDGLKYVVQQVKDQGLSDGDG